MTKIVKVPKGKSFRSRLIDMRACGWEDDSESVGWVGRKSLRTAWRLCDRGNWMMWLAGRVDVDRRLLVLAACDCARLALRHARGPGALHAIETAEAWTRGEATIVQVRTAAYASARAGRAAAYAYARASRANSAAYAAADAAAYAAYDSTYAYAAADAAQHAAIAYVAATFAEHVVCVDTLGTCADLVRKRISVSTIEAAMRDER
jgi:hypothetical protein